MNKEAKEQLRSNRLQQLERRFFELEMDRISLEAVGDTKGLETVKKRKEDVRKSYQALLNADINKTDEVV